jgi:hypothetical protein
MYTEDHTWRRGCLSHEKRKRWVQNWQRFWLGVWNKWRKYEYCREAEESYVLDEWYWGWTSRKCTSIEGWFPCFIWYIPTYLSSVLLIFHVTVGNDFDINIIDLWSSRSPWPLCEMPKSYFFLVKNPWLWRLNFRCSEPKIVHECLFEVYFSFSSFRAYQFTESSRAMQLSFVRAFQELFKNMILISLWASILWCNTFLFVYM